MRLLYHDQNKIAKGLRIAGIVLILMLLALGFGSIYPGCPVYAASTVTAQIPVSQTFDPGNGDGSISDTFNYEIKALTSGAPMPQGATGDTYSFAIDSTADESIDIDYTVVGEYDYELKQIDDGNPGYTYDAQVYTLKVYILNDGQGGLSTQVIIVNSAGDKPAKAEFNCGYNAAPCRLDVDPPVRKIITGTPPTEEIFTFELAASNPANPMPQGSSGGIKTMTIRGAGTGEFGTWEYNHAGTYEYKVREVAGSNAYRYDTTIYTITDTVSDTGGQLTLVARTIVDDQGNAVAVPLEFRFTNEYTGKATTPGGTNVQTGDRSRIVVYIGLLIMTAVMMILLLILGGRRRKNR